MDNPAFQLIEPRFATSGAFGTTDYDAAPFGGSDWPPVELPPYHLSSDDLQRQYHRKASEIVHRRNGIIVSARSWATILTWGLNIAIMPEADLGPLSVFFDARVFKLLPNGNTGEFIRVHWVSTEFNPRYIKPGFYSLTGLIEEFPG